MVLDPFFAKRMPRLFGHISIAAFIAAIFGAIAANGVAGPAFSNLLIVDGFATFFRVLVLTIGILSVLSSYLYLEREKAETSEYHALMLFSVVGQCLMVASNDLIMIFIGLEISSIASYILAGYLRDDKRNNEAALKYFLMGSFATAFFLYGVAITYGLTGSTQLDVIRGKLSSPEISLPVIGVAAALMLVGLSFKVSGAPFQMWAPDVYQGAPRPRQRVHGHRPEGRCLRHPGAHFYDSLRAKFPCLGAVHLDLRFALDDDRQLRRPHPEQPEAHVRV